MKRLLLLFTAALFAFGSARGDEGMWLLPYLQKINARDMKAKGLKLKPSEIYNESGTALKDAIVIFGNGCTGEIVSAEGLLLTNHHCGYGSIQALSSVEHDYLKNGFWALSREEEIPAPGLSVRFIRHIEEVTDRVVPAIFESEEARNEKVKENIAELTRQMQTKYPDLQVSVRDFFGGNRYFAFAVEEYGDVRLVGTPPSSIGKFGGDTDNWMWPRHTGDFSVFRVYSDKEGRPADYSPRNVPYKSPAHLKISLGGYREGDFAMIMGFPGSTSRYMTSWEIDRTLEVDNPNRIFIRGVRQEILMEDMKSSDLVRIKYAAKYAGSSNYWKNSIGMSRGLRKLGVKAEKQGIERRFAEWANGDPARDKYRAALPKIKSSVKAMTPYMHVNQYLSETTLRGVELVSAASLTNLFKDGDGGFTASPDEKAIAAARRSAANFYKDYNRSTDIKVARAMMRILRDSLTPEQQPSIFAEVINKEFGGDTDAYADHLYNNSIYADEETYYAFLDNYDVEKLKSDPAFAFFGSVFNTMRANSAGMSSLNAEYAEGKRLFIKGLMEMDPDRMYYPDANFTLRLTYGNILPYEPRDAVFYDYYTTLEGVMEKEDAANPEEFTVDDRLKSLHAARDYGQYGENGTMPVGFISNNDITGGNSGSPVMDARGNLIGLAFDGNWEAMSGDIAFEHQLQRCINVDIRYVLFIIDKYAGAGYLLDEMTIVG